jgi:hypothetical protein
MVSVTSASRNKKPADKPVMEPARPLGKLLQTAWNAIDQKASQQERVRFQKTISTVPLGLIQFERSARAEPPSAIHRSVAPVRAPSSRV